MLLLAIPTSRDHHVIPFLSASSTWNLGVILLVIREDGSIVRDRTSMPSNNETQSFYFIFYQICVFYYYFKIFFSVFLLFIRILIKTYARMMYGPIIWSLKIFHITCQVKNFEIELPKEILISRANLLLLCCLRA